MPVAPLPSTLARSRSFTRSAAIFTAAVGIAVLLGWLFDIAVLKSLAPGLATMKVNTALCFVATGVALWLARASAQSHHQHRVGRWLAVFVATTGTLTLVQYVSGVDVGIDQLFFRDPDSLNPGRMAPTTAVSFVCVGLALWCLPVTARVSQWLALVVLMISTLAIVGYAFGVSSLYRVGAYTSMAVHTALSHAVLALGILAARPDDGLLRVVNSNSMGGIVARRLLPLMPVVLFCLGLIPLAGQVLGLHDGRFGLAFMVTISMMVSTVLVAHTARALFQLDLKRAEAEGQIRILNEGLERRVAERTRELEESLGRVKQLRGLLPICAWCKKIRDDQDYWHQVEDYVSDNTDAKFSHGVCPECLKSVMQE
jgi:hypothetical protein